MELLINFIETNRSFQPQNCMNVGFEAFSLLLCN